MSTNVNKHGLSRSIPANIKRLVRQRCGFGCIVCGLGIIQYEHVEPEFHDAAEHDPEKIVLLCPQCHAKVTTKFWSKEKIKAARLNPMAKRVGYSKEVFDFGDGQPVVQLGGIRFSNCSTLIEVSGIPLFKVEEPEMDGAPFRLSGIFCDSNGDVSLRIQENEWLASTDNWDVEVGGGAIVIREGLKKIHLKLKAEPPHLLIVEKLDMKLGDMAFKLEADGNCLKFYHPNGCATFKRCEIKNFIVGLSFI